MVRQERRERKGRSATSGCIQERRREGSWLTAVFPAVSRQAASRQVVSRQTSRQYFRQYFRRSDPPEITGEPLPTAGEAQPAVAVPAGKQGGVGKGGGAVGSYSWQQSMAHGAGRQAGIAPHPDL